MHGIHADFLFTASREAEPTATIDAARKLGLLDIDVHMTIGGTLESHSRHTDGAAGDHIDQLIEAITDTDHAKAP